MFKCTVVLNFKLIVYIHKFCSKYYLHVYAVYHKKYSYNVNKTTGKKTSRKLIETSTNL